jgi:hypothetical protein
VKLLEGRSQYTIKFTACIKVDINIVLMTHSVMIQVERSWPDFKRDDSSNKAQWGNANANERSLNDF